jgi:HD-GYP domain-containing protein (c-di-GMP phosphodiesterase class II)
MLLDLREVIFVLSGVLDFVGVSDLHHGKRVAFISHEIGRALGLPGHQQGALFEAALLHDAGVSTMREHTELLAEYTVRNAHWHCERGRTLLEQCAPLANLAPLVEEHHTPWQRLSRVRQDLEPWQRIAANIIHLADRVDVLAHNRPGPDPLLRRDDILGTLRRGQGSQYAPEVLDAFEAASAPAAFWFAQEPEALMQELAPLSCDGRLTSLSMPVLIDLASVFARIVDAKSPFTAAHSAAVGEISARLGSLAGLSDEVVCRLQVAGLLHDIGKLRIPDTLLDKDGPLDAAERAVMNRHAYYTYGILRQINGFGDIALWASSHHETLDGSGYPFGRHADDIPLEARIIAVADVFQALAQNRPYRPAMALPKILDILGSLADRGKLDTDLVRLASAGADELAAYSAAPPPALAPS